MRSMRPKYDSAGCKMGQEERHPAERCGETMENNNWGGVWDENRTGSFSAPGGENPPETRTEEGNPETGRMKETEKVPVSFGNAAQGNGPMQGGGPVWGYENQGGTGQQYAGSPSGAWPNQPYQNPPRPNQGYPGGGYRNPNPNIYQTSPYQGAPQMPEGFVDGAEEPVKISEWILTLVLLSIPCVNLIMLFVWGFGSTEKKSKANFCKASLIYAGIVFAIVFLIYIVVAAGIIAGLT